MDMKISTNAYWTRIPNPAGETEKLRTACRDFESMLLEYMLKTMRETVPEGGLFSGGRGEEIFRGMQDQAFAQEAARAGGIGLAQCLFTQLSGQKGGRLNESVRAADEGARG
jgi:flagellar protein FlgJ